MIGNKKPFPKWVPAWTSPNNPLKLKIIGSIEIWNSGTKHWKHNTDEFPSRRIHPYRINSYGGKMWFSPSNKYRMQEEL